MESVVFVTLLAAITVTLCSSAAVVPVGEGKIFDGSCITGNICSFDFAPQKCQSVFEVHSFSPQTDPSSAQYTRISASLTSCAPLHSGATFPLSKSRGTLLWQLNEFVCISLVYTMSCQLDIFTNSRISIKGGQRNNGWKRVKTKMSNIFFRFWSWLERGGRWQN